MVARSRDFEAEPVRQVGLIGSEDMGETQACAVAQLPFHTVVHKEPWIRSLAHVEGDADIVPLVLNAIDKDALLRILGDLDSIVDVEKGPEAGKRGPFRAYPLGAAPALVHKGSLEPVGLRLDPASVREHHINTPIVSGRTLQAPSVIRDIGRTVIIDDTGIIDKFICLKALKSFAQLEPVGFLEDGIFIRFQLVAEVGTRVVDAHCLRHRVCLETAYDHPCT